MKKNGVNRTGEPSQSVPPQGRQPQHGDPSAKCRTLVGGKGATQKGTIAKNKTRN